VPGDWDYDERDWSGRMKHKLPGPNVSKKDIVDCTKNGRPARYFIGWPAETKAVELDCCDPKKKTKPLYEDADIRYYFEELDYEVGASNGEPTKIVYVEWGRRGNVHGRPITAKELKTKMKMSGA